MLNLLKNIGSNLKFKNNTIAIIVFLIFIFIGMVYFGPSRKAYCIVFYFISLSSLILFFLKKKFKHSSLTSLVFLYAFYLIIKSIQYENIFEIFKIILWTFIYVVSLPYLFNYIKEKKNILLFSALTLISIVSFISLIFYIYNSAYQGRLALFFYEIHPNQSSVLLLIGIIIFCYLLIKKLISSSWVTFFLMLIINMTIFFTHSRAGIISMFICYIFTFFMVSKLNKIKISICLAISSFLFFSSPLSLAKSNTNELLVSGDNLSKYETKYGKKYMERTTPDYANFQGLFTTTHSRMGRYTYWKELISNRMEKKDYIFGRSFNESVEWKSMKNTHSIYIWNLYYLGFIGLILILLIQFNCFLKIKKYLGSSDPPIFSLLVFFPSIIHFLAHGSIIIKSPEPYNMLFWLPLIIIIQHELFDSKIISNNH